MSSTKLSDAFDKVLADGSYTQGALVIKDSKLVYERYRGIAVNEEKTLKDKTCPTHPLQTCMATETAIVW